MPQTAVIRTRIGPRRKARAEKILNKLGVIPTARMFQTLPL